MQPEQRLSDALNLIYTVIIAVLFTGNIYFVKRLVDKLESLEGIVWQLRQDVVVLQTLRGDKHERRY